MKKTLILFIFFIFHHNLFAQNRVFDKAEMVNYDILDLKSVFTNQWSTTRGESPGKFANYGAAVFKYVDESLDLNSTPERWIDGYVKHYATDGNVEHLYPVGNETSRFFLKTSDETPGKDISVAWISGDPKTTEDYTEPHSGFHNTNNLEGLSSIIDIGQWDWITDFVDAEPYVIVSVKIPDGLDQNNPSFCLAGWLENSWRKLSNGPVNGILTAYIRKDYSALAIGKAANAAKTTADGTQNAIIGKPTAEKLINFDSNNFFEVFPNPASSNGVTLNYKIDYVGAAKILLYDMLGKLVYEESIYINSEVNSNIVNTSGLSKGIYTLLMNDVDHAPLMQQKKIIIQN